jgi:hypothetical protein
MVDRPLRIFMSYRRQDARGFAGGLAWCLEERYGEENIFRDVEDIGAGVDFAEEIERQIRQCDVVLCLMGAAWATVAGVDEQPRLHDATDYVRTELETAFRRKKNVLPILLEDAQMPVQRRLPQALWPITRLNAHRLTDAGWREDVQRLFSYLETVRLQLAMGKMRGEEILKRFQRGDQAPSWVGRSGGFSGRLFTTDVQTGTWRTQLYQVQFGGNRPIRNWFSIEEFAEAVTGTRAVGPEVQLPTSQELLWPTLEAVKALGGSATVAQIETKVMELISATEQQRKILHGQGPRTEIGYLVAWARSRLKAAGVLENVERGIWSVTERGKELGPDDMTSFARGHSAVEGAHTGNVEANRQCGSCFDHPER